MNEMHGDSKTKKANERNWNIAYVAFITSEQQKQQQQQQKYALDL